MSLQTKHLYQFGRFSLDPVKRRLMRDGEVVKLTPKAFETLLALVEQRGKTIEKDELLNKVWAGTVVEENNLNQSITALRKSLGDSREKSEYIATIPGVGYRFVAEVTELEEPAVVEPKPIRRWPSPVRSCPVGLRLAARFARFIWWSARRAAIVRRAPSVRVWTSDSKKWRGVLDSCTCHWS